MIINPPIAKKIAKQFENHGIIRQDNYYWLNDRENPEVIQYLEDEKHSCTIRIFTTRTLQ